ncbi:unnamed protein product [Lymnaea stagnalis]|uniref:UBA domain-containing protein n=1 Tax=Lymnaea stagnalis TaxID=6523 RepID=A0AAV2H7G3_LYMST
MDEQGPRRLRELFRGRFRQEEAIRLIQQLGGVAEAADFIFNNDPAEINRILNRSDDYIETLRAESEMLNIRLVEELESDSADHLFACQPCERSWWKRVPNRKKVSKCYKCHQKYEPIPRHLEWGLGVFNCPNQHCRNEFKGKATMGMTKSICHKCNYLVKVDHILPPKKGPKMEPKDNHNCNGINCFSPNPPDDRYKSFFFTC